MEYPPFQFMIRSYSTFNCFYFRWTKKIDIFSMEKLFFPINQRNSHWTLAVVFVTLKRIRYYDSLAGRGDLYLKSLLQYLSDEADAKQNMAFDKKDWEIIHCCEDDTPQQRNGVDCGVFATMFADFITDNIPVTELNQESINEFRSKICYAISNGYIPYDL